jgi:putative flavoprotein involved in K+ transport
MRVHTVVIGGGQAGLAASRELTARGIEHVVLERGRVGERWRSERWDSLHLLTPRWMARLPGWSYRGPDPDGFMSRTEVIAYLEGYAASFPAPIVAGVTVTRVERSAGFFVVETDHGTFHSAAVIVATGQCDRPFVPPQAAHLAADVDQVVTTSYRNPEQLRPGGVLVVGASATGIQLAAEIHATGRPVTLAVGRHVRLPRSYRGRDIFRWLDEMGTLERRADAVRDLAAARAEPSLQLVGTPERRSLDLAVLQEAGVRVMGRLAGIDRHRILFADDLADNLRAADAHLARRLRRIDAHIEATGRGGTAPAAQPLAEVPIPTAERLLDLGSAGVRTVVWATGYRRRYPWLRVPVLDACGEILHDGGVTAQPDLYVLGLNFLRRRNSSFLDGVGADARAVAELIHTRWAGRGRAVA